MNDTNVIYTDAYFQRLRKVEDLNEIEHYITAHPGCSGVLFETDTAWSHEVRTVPDLTTLAYLPDLSVLAVMDADEDRDNIFHVDNCKVYTHDFLDIREYLIRFPDDKVTALIIEPDRS